jgi:hypothetical protein
LEEDFRFFTLEMALRPTCYVETLFEQYDELAPANDEDYTDCENLYTIPG